MTRNESVGMSSKRSRNRWITLGMSFLLTVGAAWGQELEDDVPANVRYFFEKAAGGGPARQPLEKLDPEAIGEGFVPGFVRVKFRDGTCVEVTGGRLGKPDVPAYLDQGRWQPSWVGDVASRTRLWQKAEKRLGRRLGDPSTYYLWILPEGLEVRDAISYLNELPEIETARPLPQVRLTPSAKALGLAKIAIAPLPEKLAGQEHLDELNVRKAWEDFGITGRFARFVLIHSATPRADSIDAPPYSVVGGSGIDRPYDKDLAAFQLSLAGSSPNDGGLIEGIAHHAQFTVAPPIDVRPSPDPNNQEVFFDPVAAISAAAVAAGPGGVVAIPFCVDTYTPSYEGCLPFDADKMTYDEIVKHAGSIGIFESAGAQVDATGNLYRINLAELTLPDWSGGNPFVPPLDSGAIIVGGFINVNGTRQLYTNYWAVSTPGVASRVRFGASSYSGAFDSVVTIASVGALAQSACRHVGVSVDSQPSTRSADFLRKLPLHDARAAISTALAGSAAVRSCRDRSGPSLRIHGPFDGVDPGAQDENVPIATGDTVRLPPHDGTSAPLTFPLQVFNDGNETLQIVTVIEYDSEENPTAETPFSFSAGKEVPTNLGPLSHANPVLEFAPEVTGTYEARVVLHTNDTRFPATGSGNTFSFTVIGESTSSAGVKFRLTNRNEGPFPNRVVEFGDRDLVPLWYLTAPQLNNPSRIVRVINDSGEAIRFTVKIQDEGVYDPAVNTDYHFDYGDRAEGNLAGKSFTLGLGEAKDMIFFYWPTAVGAHELEVQFEGSRIGSSTKETQTLLFRGETIDWPETFRFLTPRGDLVRIGTNVFTWDMGMSEAGEFEIMLERAVFGIVPKVAAAVGLWEKLDEPPPGADVPEGKKQGNIVLTWLKSSVKALEKAEYIASLPGPEELIGRFTNYWRVEANALNIQHRLNFVLTGRPWSKRSPTTWITLSSGPALPKTAKAAPPPTIRIEKAGVTFLPIGSTLDFGEVAPGTELPHTVYLRNTSSTNELTVSDFLVEGEAFRATLPKAVLQPQEEVDITVSFVPPSSGPHEGYISFSADSPGEENPFFVTKLVGVGSRPQAPTPILTDDRGRTIPSGSVYEFPAAVMNQNPPARSFTITNGGEQPLQITNLRIVDGGMYLSQGNGLSVLLGSDESASFEVTMRTSPAGAKSGFLSFDTNASPSLWTLEFRGTVTAADLSGFRLERVDTGEVIPPGAIISFPDIEAHSGTTIELRAVNGGNYAVRPGLGALTESFCLCPRQGSTQGLPAGESWLVDAIFSPEYEGALRLEHRVTLSWKVGERWERGPDYPLVLEGSALPSAGDPRLRFETAQGEVIPNGGVFEVGQVSSYERLQRELRLVNVSNETVEAQGWGVTGRAFAVEPWSSTTTLGPGESVALQVWLREPQDGIYEAHLYNELVDVVLRAVVGDGVILELDDGTRHASGEFIDFPRGTLPDGSSVAVKIRNLGLADVDLGDVTVTGGGAFQIVDPPAPQTLAAGGEVSFTVELAGAVAGTHLADLRVPLTRLDGTDASLAARLRGWIWPSSDPSPLLEVIESPDSSEPEYFFHGDRLAAQRIGASSAAGLAAGYMGGGIAYFPASWRITLRNGGDQPLELGNISASSPHLSVLLYPESNVLEPGQSVDAYLSFATGDPGEYLESLTIETNDPFSPLRLDVPVQVDERSILEVRGPGGSVLSSGDVVNLGSFQRYGALYWEVPVSIHNAGHEPLYVARIGIDDSEGSVPVFPTVYAPQGSTSILPGRSFRNVIAVAHGYVGPIRATITIAASDRSQEPIVFEIRGRSDTDAQGYPSVLNVLGPYGRLPSGGPRATVAVRSTAGDYGVGFYLENLAQDSDRLVRIDGVSIEGAAWTLEELSDTAIGGGYETLDLRFSTASPGRYDGRVTIHNNSPVDPYVIDIRGVVLAVGPLAKVYDVLETEVPRQGTFPFPDVNADTTISRAFFVYNGGNYPVRIDEDGILVNGDGFTLIDPPDPPVVIEPNQQVPFRVRFRRPAAGTYTGQVTFSTNEGPDPYVFQLSARVVDGVTDPAVTAPELHVVRNWDNVELGAGGVVAYGDIPTGQPVSRRFRIENHGSEDLDLSLPVVSGPCASLIEQPDLTVAAGDVTYFRVRLQCGTAGPASGTVSIASDDPASPFVFTVAGDVVDLVPVLQVSQAWDGAPVANGGVFDFVETTPTGDPMSRRFRIDNAGEAELSIANPAALVSGTCFHLIEEPDATVPIGGTTYFRVRVLCNTAGSYTGQVTIASNDPLSGGSFGFSVIATVEERLAEIAVFQAWDGAPVAAGSTFTYPESPQAGKAVSRRFRIDNPGTADLALASPLALVSGACFSQIEDPPATIPAGGSAYFRVRLACSEPGPKSGAVTIAAADGSVPAYAFSLAGSVLDPDPLIQVRQGWDGVALIPGGTALVPGSFTLEETAVAASFFLDNPGIEPLEILNVSGLLGGVCFHPDPAAAVPSTIPAGGSVEVPLRVYCSTPGVAQGELRVSTSRDGVTADGYFSAALQATVIEPELRVVRGWPGADPAEIAGGDSVTLPIVAAAGDPNTSVAFQIVNDGQGALFVGNAGPAMVAGECFSIRVGGYPEATVLAGGSTPFRVWWGESCAPGEYTATITVASNDADEDPLTFTVVGLVEPPPPVVEVARSWDLAPVADGSTIDFPNAVSIGVASSAAFQVTNPLAEPITFETSSGVTGACFSITPGEPIPASLNAGATAVVRVRVLCDSAGEKLGTVTLATSTATQTHAPFTFTLRAVVDPPEIRVVRGWPGADPAEIASGQVIGLPTVAEAGDPNHSVAFQIYNDGPGELAVENPDSSLVSGICFSIRSGGYPEATVPAGGMTPFRVWWGGSCEPGEYTATITVRSNDADEDPLTFTVVGQVEPPPPAVEVARNWDLAPVVDGSTIDFPNAVSLGVASSAAFQVTNPLAETLTFEAPSGITGACFSITAGEPIPASLAAGASAIFRVRVLCSNGGEKLGTVTLATHTATQTQAPFTFTLRAVVDAPDIRVVRGWPGANPSEISSGQVIDLPTVAVAGDTNHSAAFQIHNSGAGTLVIENPDASLVSGTCFSTRSGGFPAASVAPGDFTPFRVWWGGSCTQPGDYTATVSILSNDPDEDPLTFQVRGTVAAVPQLTCQPSDARVVAGQTASFSVCVTQPNGTLTYSWLKDGQAIAGSGATLSLAAVADADEGAYSVRVANEAGSVNSQTATLTVVEKPVVSRPANRTVAVGGTASFSVTVSSPSEDGPFAYHWQKLPPGASSYQTISGATSATLTVANVTLAMSGTRYRCLVSNDAGQTNSGYATLTVATSDVAVTRAWDGGAVAEGSTFDFGTAERNVPKSYLFRITNTGQGTLTITNPTSLVNGTCWSEIEYAASSVAPGGSTTFRVRLYCGSTGLKTGTIRIYSNDPSSPYTFYVRGTVVASDVLVQQAWDNATVGVNSTQSFGSVQTGVATSKRYRITNTGQATLTISNPTSLVAGTCWSQIENAASTVAPGGSTYFRVRLLCSSTGTKSGTITINSNDPSSPYRFYTQGTVTAPDPGNVTVYRAWNGVLQSEGTTFPFPDTTTGTAVSRRFRITNTGTGTLVISNPTSLVSGTCWSQIENAASSVAPGGSTYFRVRLLCNATGTKTGTVTINSNDPSSPYRFYVQGTVN